MNLKKSYIADANSEANKETLVQGMVYHFRTVTMYTIGKYERESHIGNTHFIHLNPTYFVQDTGNFQQFLTKGTPSSGCPMPDGNIINVDSIVDIQPFNSPIPTKEK